MFHRQNSFIPFILLSSLVHSFLRLSLVRWSALRHVLASVSLSPVPLFRFNVFFSRSVPTHLSRTTFVNHSSLLCHLLVSLYRSVPRTASFYLLAATRLIAPPPPPTLSLSFPLSLSPSPFLEIYVRYSDCYKLPCFIDEKHRDSMFVRMGEHCKRAH